MNEKLLARLSDMEALEKAATPGPWEEGRADLSKPLDLQARVGELVSPSGDAELGNWMVAERVHWPENRALIRSARNSHAPLVALVRVLLEERSRSEWNPDAGTEHMWCAVHDATDAAVAAFLGTEVAR